ncbi:nitrous oxide reductase family maturation protein NosD [Streptomyces sp. NBC_01408]|uniref:right-handed parallel beta-helix repeat-containing protein n=1 Tax=Streptomyces sp. NBC_01408 TaxID=2903855 RepID=UPI002257AEA7|nr:right-handed parallel beta-helix repeat-containing protein [Streptomyces sp. NBC_01408]MCX4694658.1 right-handed parallel beta-helix repeat-containing protein [Streptomyces sp. NBC_01408]
MTNRQLKYLTCISVVMAAGIGAAAPSATATATATVAAARHTVRAGESIQEAVDAAKPGDTITVMPGTYRENVLITKRLTLRGWGSQTVIMPPAAAPAPLPARAVTPCSQADTGICVMGTAARTVDRVTIRALTLSGFKRNGLWASYTDRLTVEKVTSEKNGTWGMAQEHSTRGVFRYNVARDNAESGIFIANTVAREGGAIDTLGAVVRRNTLTGNRIGVTARRVRNMTIHDNTLTGNCGGVFVVGDEGEPGAGDMTIRGNRIHANNKFCRGNSRLPDIQGAGIVLTGAEETIIRTNSIRDNVGASPISGGILLFKSFVGAQNTDNVIRDNLVRGNKPADLANQGTGTGNTFRGNQCQVSQPAGMC